MNALERLEAIERFSYWERVVMSDGSPSMFEQDITSAIRDLIAVARAAELVSECEDALTVDGYVYLVNAVSAALAPLTSQGDDE